MDGQANRTGSKPLRVGLVALPDAVISTLAGIYDVMNGVALMGIGEQAAPPPFEIAHQSSSRPAPMR